MFVFYLDLICMMLYICCIKLQTYYNTVTNLFKTK